MAFGIPAFSAAAAPAGIESPQKAMLCGPPDTLMNRTVVPGAIVSVLGSNAATLLPLPVILTSTTGPLGAGVAAGWLAGVCVWSAFFSPPQARAPSATTVVSRVKRIANDLRIRWLVGL